MTAALELDDLEIRYGAVAAVRRLSLEVGHGEIVGLIGPNGAGKSTLLNAIMGLVPVHGAEGRRIYANLTVAENLRLGLTGRRTRGAAARNDDIAWVHDLFPAVAQFADRPAGTLSGGQQQQLAIARALVARPDVLLLDEPSLGLAPQLVTVVFDVLAQIRERGVTVLLVEQRAQRTVAFADRTYVLSNGELVTMFTPRDADDTERLVAAYFGS